jgi:tetratricopeptide (TPR) repeat protein
MNDAHLLDEILTAVALEEYLDIDGAAAEHLDYCTECRARLAEYRDLATALAFDYAPPASTAPPEAFLRALHETETRLRDETRQGESQLMELRNSPLDLWPGAVSNLPPTTGLAKALAAEAREHLKTDPRAALAIASLGLGVVDHATGGGRAHTLGTLQKERANALRKLGRYEDALAALDAAQAAFVSAGAIGCDLGVVEWARATTFFEMRSYELALLHVESAIPLLSSYGQSRLALQAQILRAGIIKERGDIVGARTLYDRLTTALHGMPELAYVYAGIAECELCSGGVDAARSYLERAAEVYRAAGQELELIRARRQFAAILRRRGFAAAALDEYRAVASHFLTLGMVVDAADVNLDIIEELLRRGDTSAAEQLAASTMDVFAASGDHVGFAQALAFLRNALLGGAAAGEEALGYVRRYLHEEDGSTFPPPHHY